MNPYLSLLQPYPFEKLRALLTDAPKCEKSLISLHIGEPRHPAPPFILQALTDNFKGIGNYPTTLGSQDLRESIASWLIRRFKLNDTAINPQTMILPVNGTREALFSFVQATINTKVTAHPIVAMPNPFYQIYEGATLLAGAEPVFIDANAENGYLPDLDEVPDAVWQRCQLLFLCSPGNPTGRIAPIQYLQNALRLAEKYGFLIASDECYSEIYFDENSPPPGLLEVAAGMGNHTFKQCVVFHSLSKRSSIPGLRSGFVAGDAAVLKDFLLYRTYHGCAMPPPTQAASALAWRDEAHVVENRRLYQQKFSAVLPILSPVLNVTRPDAGFYLWPAVPDDETFARSLFAEQHVMVLPGRYLSRHAGASDPGRGRVRISLVAELAECIEAANRIRAYVASH